jgi:CO/xanthine dehydrogenase Mo-binding subunit
MVEVDVDPETGGLQILKITTLHDVGTIINTVSHQVQIEGGLIQGLGFALIEQLPDEKGRIVAGNLGEYKLPNIADIPVNATILVRDDDGPGPFGSKPIGESSISPTAPAIANAVYDAIGVQIRDLPITSERIYAALRKT